MAEEKAHDQIRKRKEKWLKEKFEKEISRETPLDVSNFNPLYTPADVNIDYMRDLGVPGEYPFTRGIYPSMYLGGKLWTMRQVCGYGTPEETRKRLEFLFHEGETQLAVVGDIPTREGYDSDHPMAEGEVGKLGVPIDSMEDIEKIFEGLPIESIRPALIESCTGTMAILAMYFAFAEKRGIALEKLAGTIQNDPLTNTFSSEINIFPPEDSMRIVSDIFEFCSKKVPRWTTVNVGGRTMRDLEITAAQELGITMIFGIAYVEAARRRGLDIDAFAPRIAHYLGAHNNFFEEIAKFRAARRMWAKIMKERFGAKNPKSWICRYHVKTTAVALTPQQPLNNIIRGTIHGLAAVLGGTQSLDICSYDEAMGLPTEESVRMSLRTQQIIAYESGVTEFIDPCAGSWYVEHLTKSLEDEANGMISDIEKMGIGSVLDGLVKAIRTGYLAKQFASRYSKVQQQIFSGERVVVGVNKFQSEEDTEVDVFKVDPDLEKKQIENLNALRRKRNSNLVRNSLDKLRRAAKGEVNLMPPTMEAVKNYATLGEVVETLRGVFGFFERPLV